MGLSLRDFFIIFDQVNLVTWDDHTNDRSMLVSPRFRVEGERKSENIEFDSGVRSLD